MLLQVTENGNAAALQKPRYQWQQPSDADSGGADPPHSEVAPPAGLPGSVPGDSLGTTRPPAMPKPPSAPAPPPLAPPAALLAGKAQATYEREDRVLVNYVQR